MPCRFLEMLKVDCHIVADAGGNGGRECFVGGKVSNCFRLRNALCQKVLSKVFFVVTLQTNMHSCALVSYQPCLVMVGAFF